MRGNLRLSWLSYHFVRQQTSTAQTFRCCDLAVDLPLSQLAESIKARMAFITYLAEDNEKIVENLIETLSEIANVKVTAHSATQTEASRWLTLLDGKWHLAIVDLFLEEGSGLGILAGCRNREPYQKIVLLTNYATPEIRKRATALGADAVFDKSTELELLLAYCIEHTANVKSEETQEAEREAVERGAVVT